MPRCNPPRRRLDVGADVVLLDPVAVEEVVAQLRALVRRQTGSAREAIPSGRLRLPPRMVLDGNRRHVTVGGRRIALTHLEGELLAAFLARPAEVLDDAELLRIVWGSPFGARSTVSAYIRRLRVKIEPDPADPVFIRTVWGAGYVYWPDGGQ